MVSEQGRWVLRLIGTRDPAREVAVPEWFVLVGVLVNVVGFLLTPLS